MVTNESLHAAHDREAQEAQRLIQAGDHEGTERVLTRVLRETRVPANRQGRHERSGHAVRR
jgi:hypothetical protein